MKTNLEPILMDCFVDVVWLDLNVTPERVGGIHTVTVPNRRTCVFKGGKYFVKF